LTCLLPFALVLWFGPVSCVSVLLFLLSAFGCGVTFGFAFDSAFGVLSALSCFRLLNFFKEVGNQVALSFRSFATIVFQA
jgi:hypothetical protein